jgi:hypothetical protein
MPGLPLQDGRVQREDVIAIAPRNGYRWRQVSSRSFSTAIRSAFACAAPCVMGA